MNGYFQIITIDDGYGLKVVPPTDGGTPISIGEVTEYLNRNEIKYSLDAVKTIVFAKDGGSVRLGDGECPKCNETYRFSISEDMMEATAFFLPPSETGEAMSLDEFLKDMKFRKVVFGLQLQTIKQRFDHHVWCEEIKVAIGKEPRQGRDAELTYLFPTQLETKPKLNEDGSVDFFNLNNINPCKKGQILAKITPEDLGEDGKTINGTSIRPRAVKKITFNFGRNIEVSEDRLALISQVDGHVMLVGDKVFVSNVFEVKDVDTSTGNIEFEGSVQINGNVLAGFSVKAGGNVVIKGVVEGASIEAGGDIVITLGMNGMGKGTLKAGGNIISKFIENSYVSADGYISTESILHSDVSSGSEIIVTGRKGFITGGHVCAGNRVQVKTLGSNMGAATIIEVGVNPKIRQSFLIVQKEMLECQNAIKNAQPLIMSFKEKKERGANIKQDQIEYIKSLTLMCEEKKKELIEKKDIYLELQRKVAEQGKGVVEVGAEAYPGTVIAIQDKSLTLQKVCSYCKFILESGEIKLTTL